MDFEPGTAKGDGIFVPYYGDRYDLFSISTSCIPMSDNNGTGRAKTKVVERDDYGRELFLFTCGKASTYYPDSEVGACYAYLICQKTEDDRTYFYKDEYIVTSSKNKGAITEERIEALKAANDWNKALNEEKMNSMPIFEDFVRNVPESNIEPEKVLEKLGLDPDCYDAEIRIFGTHIKHKRICLVLILEKEMSGKRLVSKAYLDHFILIADENVEFDREKDILDLGSEFWDFSEEVKAF